MNFNESNTVEAYIRDLLCGASAAQPSGRRTRQAYGAGWTFKPGNEVERNITDAFVESSVRTALIRLNPDIAAEPDRADEVLYKLRAIVLGVRSGGLVSANEECMKWLRGEKTMPFGKNHEHVSVRLLDFENADSNECIVTSQYHFRSLEQRIPDLVLLVNGFPLVIIEAKTPVRKAVSWFDAADQVHNNYEKNIPELFVANVFSVASEGKELRYGAIGAPLKEWGPWRNEGDASGTLADIGRAVTGLLQPGVILEILSDFSLFATDKKKRRIKIIGRYQQFHTARAIVTRVTSGRPRKGLIWHFQGSGKSLLMVFAAQKLRMDPRLHNPTVIIVVDRVDLDSQISATFHASDIPNLVKADTRAELQRLLKLDQRKIIITTIFKFGEAGGVLNDRENIILLCDEAHRTQEGNLGRKMREALPNAFLFGLTGTPINKRDRNTFLAFGAVEDASGYMSRYGFEESIRDGATLPLHFEPRLMELHIDKEAIDREYEELTGELTDLDKDNLGKAASKMGVLVKAPERISKICADIAKHFQEKVQPHGLKGMVVTYDQDSCLRYKEALDQHLPGESSAIVISVPDRKTQDDDRYKDLQRSKEAEELLLDDFRDPNHPLEILIVTAKLLTGFDAPILHAMYLDKPLKQHTLLQAITRTNRTYGPSKTHGLIVDYLGVFDEVAQSLEFDEKSFQNVIKNVEQVKEQLPATMTKCLAYFPNVDRSIVGYEGLMAAQECLPGNDRRDEFAADFSVLNRVWETVSPDPMLSPYETDYRWLAQVYQSVQPTSGAGRLIWHSLGAQTIELIHRHVHVEAVKDDLDDIVLDAEVLEAVLGSPDPKKKAKEIEFKITRRLRIRMGDPKFKALSERLEALRARHEQGQIHSVQFLKELLDLAKELLQAERETPPEQNEDRGKAALTELFQDVQNADTPVMVRRIVDDIDEIVRNVRFEGWQSTSAGEREVKKVLRKTLFKYKLHSDPELFEKAYGYIREYY